MSEGYIRSKTFGLAASHSWKADEHISLPEPCTACHCLSSLPPADSHLILDINLYEPPLPFRMYPPQLCHRLPPRHPIRNIIHARTRLLYLLRIRRLFLALLLSLCGESLSFGAFPCSIGDCAWVFKGDVQEVDRFASGNVFVGEVGDECAIYASREQEGESCIPIRQRKAFQSDS